MHLIDRLEVEEQGGRARRLFSGTLVQHIEYPVVAASSTSRGRQKRSRAPQQAQATAVSATEMPFCGPWTLEIPPQFRVGPFSHTGTATLPHSPTPPSFPEPLKPVPFILALALSTVF